MDENRPDRAALTAFALIVLMGGSNVVAVRFSNRELDPLWGAAIRFAAASAVLFGVVLVKRLPLPRGRALALTLLYGALGFAAAYALAYWGLVEVPAGIAGVMLASVPLLTFFLALGHGLERFRVRGLIGAILAVAGIAVMFAEPPGGAVPILSLLAVIGVAVCAAESAIVVKKIPASHPITTNAVAMTFGTAVLFGLSAATRETWSLPSRGATWGALLYLALIGSTLLFGLYVFVLQRWTASAASYQFVLFPLVAVTMGAVLLGEPITASVLVGAPLVLAGVYVGALAPDRRVAAPATPR